MSDEIIGTFRIGREVASDVVGLEVDARERAAHGDGLRNSRDAFCSVLLEPLDDHTAESIPRKVDTRQRLADRNALGDCPAAHRAEVIAPKIDRCQRLADGRQLGDYLGALDAQIAARHANAYHRLALHCGEQMERRALVDAVPADVDRVQGRSSSGTC